MKVLLTKNLEKLKSENKEVTTASIDSIEKEKIREE